MNDSMQTGLDPLSSQLEIPPDLVALRAVQALVTEAA